MHHRKVEREVEAIRIKVLEQEPFWAVVACKLDIIVCDEWYGRPVPTAATDGTYLWVNPEYWSGLTLGAKLTLMLHEIGHVALGHQLRRQERNQEYFNIACDHVINNILNEQGYDIPSTWMCDKQYAEASEERVYAKIYPGNHHQPPPPPGEKPGTEPPNGPVVIVPGDPEGDGPTVEVEVPTEGPGSEKGEGESPPAPPGEVWDATAPDGSALDDEQRQEKMRELTEDLQQAKHVAKTCGKSNGASLSRSVDRLVHPKMNWRSYMNRWIKEKGTPIGRTWSKLDRRSMVNRIYQPGEIKEGMEWLVLAVDVSGSIAYPEYKAFLAHIEAIRKTVKIQRITLLPFNHIVLQAEIVEIAADDTLPTDMRCGGGTAFSPVFNWVRRENKTPDGIIVFTDLCCSDYGDPVPTSILWASSEEVYKDKKRPWRSNHPPFGDAIEIDIHR